MTSTIYIETRLRYSFRNHVPLNVADVCTDGSPIVAGTTWFQSPWASAKLAHASSAALTAAVMARQRAVALRALQGRP